MGDVELLTVAEGSFRSDAACTRLAHADDWANNSDAVPSFG